ncbi:MAG TPA: YdeI/OmpD-associated family protein [Gemmatimonadales bacterium]|nr:YdeI/OmpD-associated family protein [Gemmatimonadales bacterium]
MAARLDRPVVAFASQRAWEAWLKRHHTTSPGVWLKIAKQASGHASVTYDQAVEGALCYGWIDGQKRPHDAAWWLQKFTPRRAKSIWSKINRGKALRLIKAGRMTPAGLREVHGAKRDGRWVAAYDSARTMRVPPDLQAALNKNVKAKAFFKEISAGYRYAILWRIHDAKRPETRAKRIADFVRRLQRHETLH